MTAHNLEAAKYAVKKLKEEYRKGNSTLVIVNNRSDQKLTLQVLDTGYGRFISYPPQVIPSRQCGYFFEVHRSGSPSGNSGSVAYNVDQNDGQSVAVGWSTVYSPFYRNHCGMKFYGYAPTQPELKTLRKELVSNNFAKGKHDVSSNNQLYGNIHYDKSDFGGSSPMYIFDVFSFP